MSTIKQEDFIQSIADAFFGGDQIDRNLLAFIESVRPAIKTGVISNAWNGLRDYMRKNGFLAPFDEVIVSADLKEAKVYVGVVGNPEVKQRAMRRLTEKRGQSVGVADD